MIYMGSKSKYAKYIVPILQDCIDKNNIDKYIEPFVGGANIIDKIKCKTRIGYDRSDTLIALLQLAQTDVDSIPIDGNREMWDKGKEYVKNGKMPNDMTLAEIGAIEFLGSYKNGGFPRGYAKPTNTTNFYKRALKNLKEQAPNLKDITFLSQNYYDLSDVEDCVIYCDPPYASTKIYGYATQEQMNYSRFWDWVRKISKKNFVYVSEQNAPEDFVPIWQKEVKRTMDVTSRKQTIEKLFVYKEGKSFDFFKKI